jgi:hypothetical protein
MTSLRQPLCPDDQSAIASFRGSLAVLFRSHPGEWIPHRELTRIGGFCAWRTRVSELRRPPYSMQIDNRIRRLDGYVISEYRFVAAVDRPEAAS